MPSIVENNHTQHTKYTFHILQIAINDYVSLYRTQSDSMKYYSFMHKTNILRLFTTTTWSTAEVNRGSSAEMIFRTVFCVTRQRKLKTSNKYFHFSLNKKLYLLSILICSDGNDLKSIDLKSWFEITFCDLWFWFQITFQVILILNLNFLICFLAIHIFTSFHSIICHSFRGDINFFLRSSSIYISQWLLWIIMLMLLPQWLGTSL